MCLADFWSDKSTTGGVLSYVYRFTFAHSFKVFLPWHYFIISRIIIVIVCASLKQCTKEMNSGYAIFFPYACSGHWWGCVTHRMRKSSNMEHFREKKIYVISFEDLLFVSCIVFFSTGRIFLWSPDKGAHAMGLCCLQLLASDQQADKHKKSSDRNEQLRALVSEKLFFASRFLTTQHPYINPSSIDIVFDEPLGLTEFLTPPRSHAVGAQHLTVILPPWILPKVLVQDHNAPFLPQAFV